MFYNQMINQKTSKLLYIRRPSGKSYKATLTLQAHQFQSCQQFIGYCRSIIQRCFKVIPQNQIVIFNGNRITPQVFQLIREAMYDPHSTQIIIHALDTLKIKKQQINVVSVNSQRKDRKQSVFSKQDKVIDILKKHLPEETCFDHYFLSFVGKFLNFQSSLEQELIQDQSRVIVGYLNINQILKDPSFTLKMDERKAKQFYQQRRSCNQADKKKKEKQVLNGHYVKNSQLGADHQTEQREQKESIKQPKDFFENNSQINIDIGNFLASQLLDQSNNNNFLSSKISMHSDFNHHGVLSNIRPKSPLSPLNQRKSKKKQIKREENNKQKTKHGRDLFFTQGKLHIEKMLQQTQKKIKGTGKDERKKALEQTNKLKNSQLIYKCESQVVSCFTQGNIQLSESKLIETNEKFNEFIYKYDPFAQ